MTQSELIAKYGNPVLASSIEGTLRGWCVPDVQWHDENLTVFPANSEWLTLNVAISSAWSHAYVAVDTTWITQIYGWSPRHKCLDPTRGLSMHAWGLAIDVEWDKNPYGQPNQTIPVDFVKAMEDVGFVWGGRWRVPDPMHFEFKL